jgi:Ca-activated chloride channel homolog
MRQAPLGIVGVSSNGFIAKIDEARAALVEVLPRATRSRRVGLITYGPGPYQSCNVHLDLGRIAKVAAPIMRAALTPDGRTPLTSAVEQAANILDFLSPLMPLPREGPRAKS